MEVPSTSYTILVTSCETATIVNLPVNVKRLCLSKITKLQAFTQCDVAEQLSSFLKLQITCSY